AAGGRAAGFVNGVLRAIARARSTLPWPDPAQDPVRYLSVRHSHPEWLVRRYLERLGRAETEQLLEANNAAPALTLRVNRLRAEPEQVARALRGAGYQVEAGRYLPEALRVRAQTAPDRLPGFDEGWFTPQDEAAMLVTHVLDPAPGGRVVDACAAPGTKTTHIAEYMGDEGTVVALDVDPERLHRVDENARRLGLRSVRSQVGDARRAAQLLGVEWADRVLVDAPCSGLGTLARRPDLRWRKRPEDIPALAELQGQILDGCAPLVRPGGVLVYSTCTTEPEENEQVIAAFLERWPVFRPASGVWDRIKLPAGADLEAEGKGLQLWPHRHGTDGFFIAKLERLDGEAAR
ncbi:MAG TPA: 16S rRNA (cytosine(967)-C(5))-methyltransferase RsmB, partial [Bacillota bacterium]